MNSLPSNNNQGKDNILDLFAKNVGTADRALRVIVGVALIGYALTGPAEGGMTWLGWLGIIPLVTGIFSMCPLYSILGVNTCGCCGGACATGKKK